VSALRGIGFACRRGSPVVEYAVQVSAGLRGRPSGGFPPSYSLIFQPPIVPRSDFATLGRLLSTLAAEAPTAACDHGIEGSNRRDQK